VPARPPGLVPEQQVGDVKGGDVLGRHGADDRTRLRAVEAQVEQEDRRSTRVDPDGRDPPVVTPGAAVEGHVD
jgi:hypothetical protein